MHSDQSDPLDTLLKRAPSWDPPDGFAVRVTMMARTSRDAELARLRLRDRFAPMMWLRGCAGSLRMRVDGMTWSLQQYRSLLWR